MYPVTITDVNLPLNIHMNMFMDKGKKNKIIKSFIALYYRIKQLSVDIKMKNYKIKTCLNPRLFGVNKPGINL